MRMSCKQFSNKKQKHKNFDIRKQNIGFHYIITEMSSIATSKASTETPSVFYDPRVDAHFKQLFNTEKLVTDLLQSLLKFDGETNPIESVTVENSVPIPLQSADSAEELYQPKFDVKCSVQRHNTDRPNDIVLIEMQREMRPSFLSRAQYYTARALDQSVPPGHSADLRGVMPRVLMLVFAENNVFKLDNHKHLFKETVVPMIVETGSKLDPSYMCWLFYELNRFSSVKQNVTFSTAANRGEQWLHFLDKCSTYKDIPSDAPYIFREAFDLMRVGTKEGMDAAEARDNREFTEFIGYSKRALEDKTMCLQKVANMIKSKLSTDAIRETYPFFELREVEMLIEYIDKHPACSLEDLTDELKVINGWLIKTE